MAAQMLVRRILRESLEYRRTCAVAARVKVTISRSSAEQGFSLSVRRRITRSTSTAVLPEPAAALTSTEPLRHSIACFWSVVQLIPIAPPPL